MKPNQDQHWMQLALELARRGEGFVEPNPMVGCVLVKDGSMVGQGFHEKFGGLHAEINAIDSCEDATGSTAFVTLEPCCHQGKTGPCTDALIEAGIATVVIATSDPFSDVDGRGIKQLQNAEVDVVCGILEEQAFELNRPYFKRVQTGAPWVIAKWAMTLDGKIATASGSSQWISNEQSRGIVHQIRGRVDAIMVGIGTAQADNPMLTARPAGPRTATRIVVDSTARIELNSQLVETAGEIPTAIAVGPSVDQQKIKVLEQAGCQIIQLQHQDDSARFQELLTRLGEMQFTNVLVEGGGTLLGALNDGNLIDEVHCFIAPKLVGGKSAYVAIGGQGVSSIENALELENPAIQQLGSDVYVSGRF